MRSLSSSLTRGAVEQQDGLPSIRSPMWPTESKGILVLAWLLTIHITAVVGLALYPLPGWQLLLGAMTLALLGGAGATICYHRALAHRSVRLHPAVQASLIFFALLTGVTPPGNWIPNHRFHRAAADTREDPSSPALHGLWFAHLAWYWQADGIIESKYGSDLQAFSVRIWARLLCPIFLLAYFGGALLSLRAFFWLGAIRLVFTLHANSFVHTICHT